MGRVGSPRLLVAAFAATITLGAFLLFLVQPLVGKLLLPRLGGSPAVWNTCMVFFQTSLLVGYLYAHLLTRALPPRRAVWVHALVLLLPLAVLPLAIPTSWAPPAEGGQALAALQVLLVQVGLPFFAVATASPLLQGWFATSGHADAQDPYFLYSASNLGSLAGLLAYPLLLAPLWSLRRQAWVWQGGYLMFSLATVACGLLAARHAVERPGEDDVVRRPGSEPLPSAVSTTTRLRWVALAFVPSSLMLGATQYLTTDVAAVPLLWVLPLVLYLLSFILVFARRPRFTAPAVSRRVPLVAVALALAFLLDVRSPIAVLLILHLLALFVVGLACHGRLAEERPPADRLTEFYLWIALGGALGGSFNALLAPLLFDAYLEYPLVLVLACLLRHPRDMDSGAEHEAPARGARPWLLDLALPVGLLLLYFALRLGLGQVLGGVAARTAFLAVPAVACYLLRRRRVRFALGVAVLLGIAFLQPSGTSDPANQLYGRVVHAERTFFGVHRVATTADGSRLALLHGNTVHGMQARDEVGRRDPLLYYHRQGPGGVALARLGPARTQRVGVIGLGCGALAAYVRPGQRWTFFEIDPAVARIAAERFTYLNDAAAPCAVVRGDGRLELAKQPAGTFDVIVVDAFSSDSIPIHLLTREALQLYLGRLTGEGVLLLHVTNRYLRLPPVVSALATDLGASGYVWRHPAHGEWVALARTEQHLRDIVAGGEWVRLPPAAVRVWTDDYTNLLAALGG